MASGCKPRRARASSSNSSFSLSGHAGRIGRRVGDHPERRNNQPLPNEPDPEHDIYVVESLLKVKYPEHIDDERHFYVKWLNYASSQNTWEPESNLSPDLVTQWDQEHGKQPSASSERSPGRAESKLSAGSARSDTSLEASTCSKDTAKSKGKKRQLPISPKAVTKKPLSPSRTSNSETQLEAPSSAAKVEKSVPKTGNSNNRQMRTGPTLSKSKMLEIIGPIEPERILAVYKETDDELCYLVKRKDDPLSVPDSNAKSADNLQIISAQVFDMLWPKLALDYFERSLQGTQCLEFLESGLQKEESLTTAMEGARIGERIKKAPGDGSGEDDEEAEDEYEVERVVDMQYRGNKRFYLLKWVGYSDDDNTWEPEDQLNCPGLLDAFWASRPDPDPRKKKKQVVGSKNDKSAAVLPVAKKPYKFISFHVEGAEVKGELYQLMDKWRFLVKWMGEPIPEYVHYTEAKSKWPDMVLRFFQKYLQD